MAALAWQTPSYPMELSLWCRTKPATTTVGTALLETAKMLMAVTPNGI